jgi:hypothetical protein
MQHFKGALAMSHRKLIERDRDDDVGTVGLEAK